VLALYSPARACGTAGNSDGLWYRPHCRPTSVSVANALAGDLSQTQKNGEVFVVNELLEGTGCSPFRRATRSALDRPDPRLYRSLLILARPDLRRRSPASSTTPRRVTQLNTFPAGSPARVRRAGHQLVPCCSAIAWPTARR